MLLLRAFTAAVLLLIALPGCAAAVRAPEQPAETRVILALGHEDAVWRFIPMDVLPGAAEVELDPPPPPPPVTR